MRSFLLSLLVFGALVTHATAQDGMGMIPDDQIRKMLAIGMGQIEGNLCGSKHCAPATRREWTKPLLTVPESRAVITLGRDASFAGACGINWQERSYVPMMTYWRQTRKKNERQIALVGVLHKLGRGMLQKKECSPQAKEYWEKIIDFPPKRKPFV